MCNILVRNWNVTRIKLEYSKNLTFIVLCSFAMLTHFHVEICAESTLRAIYFSGHVLLLRG